MFCPNILDKETGQMCGHLDIRVFQEVGAVEIGRTSTRGDTQPWNHITVVRCMSCDWKHVAATNPCLGNPWDEVMGFDRPMDQTTETKRKIRFSNEQAVGLRAHDEKYEKGTTLQDKRYKATRKVRSTEEDGKASQSDSVELHLCPDQGREASPPIQEQRQQGLIHMAKEVKETSISVGLSYKGLEFTLSQQVSNYELEERLDILVAQVKALSAASAGLADPEA